VGFDLPPNDSARVRDAEHLKLLGILHFVYAGIQGFFGLFFLLYIGLGLAFLWNVFPAAPPSPGSHASEPPPQWFGWLFIVVGLVLTLWFETLAVMNVLAGRFCRARRHRVFLLVVAALDCLWVPFGTVLGVFDFVVLSRESVRRLFEAEGG
jgi:hypothetical protein